MVDLKVKSRFMLETQTKISYSQTLTQAGLEPNAALVYEVLLQNGPLPAGKIHQKTPLKRGLVYKILVDLVGLGLVIKRLDVGKVAVFEPGHPLKLKELAEIKEKQAKQAQNALEGVLPQLISEFNLAAGKPGVRFFEGREGVWEVLKDSLTATDEIYSYADVESVVKYIEEINNKYVAARERLHIKKKVIFIDSPFSRKYYSNYYRDVTDLKFIKAEAPPFESVMQIYNNKVTYVTLTPEKMIGVIIEDAHIYTMHRYLFESMWQTAIPLSEIQKAA